MSNDHKEITISKAEVIVAERWLEAIKQLADAMDSGELKWTPPWLKGHAGTPRNHVFGRAYRGGNFWYLMFLPYEHQRYVTMNQIKELGGQLKIVGKKENGKDAYESPYPVVFWPFKKVVDEATGEEKVILAGRPRYHLVWNIAQVDWPEGAIKIPDFKKFDFNPIDECEKLIASINPEPDLRDGGDRAFYNYLDDFIGMPDKRQFKTSAGYYSTYFHELAHWTGHQSRLERDHISKKTMGRKSYSQEELIAEFAALMLCADTGIEAETLWNSAAYIQSWHERLNKDPEAVAIAMRLSQRAADFLTKNYETPVKVVAAEGGASAKKTKKKASKKASKKTSKKKVAAKTKRAKAS